MRTYLGLLTNAVRSALRSKHDLMLENLALRQQLAVLTRQRARTRTKPAGRLFWSWLTRYWPGWRSTLGDGAAGDGRPLAPHGVARVLDVEEPSPTPGPAAYQQRAARAHREDRNREPALGRRPHPGRATRAWLRGERGDGEVLPAEGAAASAVPVLANLPRQPPLASSPCRRSASRRCTSSSSSRTRAAASCIST